MTRYTRYAPLWLLRWLRDKQARKDLSPEEIKAAEIRHRGRVAGEKVLALRMGELSGKETRL